MMKGRCIKANPDKCLSVITMRNPTNVNELQYLTCHLFALSRFLFCAGYKAFLLFASLNKNERFEWNPKCEKAFTKVKNFLILPLILTLPRDGSPLLIYLSIIYQAKSSILVQEIDRADKIVYLTSKVFRCVEERYQKI